MTALGGTDHRRQADQPLTPNDPALEFATLTVAPDARPLLIVVVDTEEEFDWGARFSRDNTSVGAMRQIGRAHNLLARFGVRPTYVIDFPVASQEDGYAPLRELSESGACRIGAHLHPWVNPPFSEEVTPRNSFACNLGASLEREKLRVLKAEIGNKLGVDARAYKAGRYGFGRSTISALDELGFDVDLSINPHTDFSASDGPSFEAFDTRPFWFGRRRLLEFPCSVGYVGTAGRAGPALHRFASAPAFRAARLVGVLARCGIVNKIMLTPEGATLAELRNLTSTLVGQGLRTFALTFHSPSVEPGHTPYVRTQRDLDEFLARIDAYCEFFFGTLGGTTATPEEFRRSMARQTTVDSFQAPSPAREGHAQ